MDVAGQVLPRPREGLDMRLAVLDALQTGTSLASPWLQFTRNGKEVLRWWLMGKALHCDDPYVVRVRWAQLPPDLVLDMATEEAQEKFFGKWADDEMLEKCRPHSLH